MSQMSTTASLDKTPNPDAAKALGQFFGALRTELLAEGFSNDAAEKLVVDNSRYVMEAAPVTITSTISEDQS